MLMPRFAQVLRRLSWVGVAVLWSCGPVVAQLLPPDTATPSLAQPCSSAKAVHDMRCPNYTGFKTRVGGQGAAATDSQPDVGSAAEASVPAPRADTPHPTVGRRVQRGQASWYGPRFHGRRTASGERYDMHALTAAHKSLPFGTRVLVHNPRTGRRVVVRINDRGPFVRGRVIDLSRAAARAVGIHGVGHVELYAVEPGRDPTVQTRVSSPSHPAAGELNSADDDS